jgi:hypothetical protein
MVSSQDDNKSAMAVHNVLQTMCQTLPIRSHAMISKAWRAVFCCDAKESGGFPPHGAR